MHTKAKHSVKLVEDNLQSDEEWGRVGVCCVCRCAVCVQMTSCLEENAVEAHLATRAFFIVNTNFNKKSVLAT